MSDILFARNPDRPHLPLSDDEQATETGSPASPIAASAWEAIRGAYDLQVHVAPDVIARRIDDLEPAREFLAHRLCGSVLKAHYVPTAERAKVVTKTAPAIAAFGALTLNHAVGGLNPVAVEIAGRSSCKLVCMPTVDAENETAGLPGAGQRKLPFSSEIQRELRATGISSPPPATAGSVNIDLVCAGAFVHPGDVIGADQDGVVVVARGDAREVARLGEERRAKGGPNRRALARGSQSPNWALTCTRGAQNSAN